MHHIYAVHYPASRTQGHNHNLPLKHKQDGAVLGPKHRRLAMESYELLELLVNYWLFLASRQFLA